MSTNKKVEENNMVKKIISGMCAGIAALILIFGGTTIVPAGSTGVAVTFGKVSSDTMSEGLHIKMPFITKVVDVTNKIQLLEANADAVSRDLQAVSSTIAVNYKLSADFSASMYKNVGMDYENILIAPALQESMKSICSAYTAEQLITQRDLVASNVKDQLNEKLNDYGVYIEKFSIVNFDFSAEYNQAIEEKQVAEQQKLKAETDKEKTIIEAEAAAEQKRIAAQAKADAELIEAEATAAANEKISASVDEKVLMFKQLEAWDGVLPKVTGGSNGLGFILNMNEVMSAATE